MKEYVLSYKRVKMVNSDKFKECGKFNLTEYDLLKLVF